MRSTGARKRTISRERASAPATGSSPTRAPRGSTVASLAVASILALAPLAAAASPSRTTATVDAIREVLARRLVDARSRDEVLAELTRLGPGTIPDLFDVYTGRSLGELVGGANDARPEWWCNPEVFPELALDALAELPPARVVSHLAERTAGAGSETRVAAVAVLGALRSGAGLDLWLRQAEALCGASRGAPGVRDALLDSLTSILEHEPRALRSLELRIEGASEELSALVAEAAARAPGTATNGFLLGLLGRGIACDLAVLDGVGRRGARFPWKVCDETVATVRRRLASRDPRLRCAAAAALARLGDVGSVPDLLELLDARETDVRQAASRSLHRLSGRPDLAEEADWAAWYASERAWWRDRGASLVAELEEATPSRRADIARTFSGHPLERARVASELVAPLPHADPADAAELCRALGELGSPRAVPALVALLYGRDAGTREAAHEALRALTGRDLPLEPPLWSLLASGREP